MAHFCKLSRDWGGGGSGLAVGRGGRDPIGDAAFGKVVGGHFHLHFIPDVQPDVMFAHFTGNMGEDGVTINQFHTEEGALEHRLHDSFDFDNFACHKPETLPERRLERNLIPRGS